MGVAEILTVYRQATIEERIAGASWYADAQSLAATLSMDPRAGVTVSQAAGVIAALSPTTPWERNKELALRAVVDGHASGTLGNSVRAADRILAGVPVLSVLKSPKVQNFYLSIMGDPTAVCIDRHAYEVYEGKRYRDAERPSITPKRYRDAADAYVAAADTLTITATSLQAITWLVWRRIHLTGTRYERFL